MYIHLNLTTAEVWYTIYHLLVVNFRKFSFGIMHSDWIQNKTHRKIYHKRIINGVEGYQKKPNYIDKLRLFDNQMWQRI